MSYHPKGSEPQCFASHTLCGVFNAGGPCRWREVGRIRKYWGGNAGSRTTVTLVFPGLCSLTVSVTGQQGVPGWLQTGLSTSLMSPTQNPEWFVPNQGFQRDRRADISIWHSSGVRRSWELSTGPLRVAPWDGKWWLARGSLPRLPSEPHSPPVTPVVARSITCAHPSVLCPLTGSGFDQTKHGGSPNS